MHRAVTLSREHMEKRDGGPFGAVIVRDGRIIAEGWNQVTSSNDPTAHAEIVAIRRACAGLGTFTLTGAVIYSSCEPCPMCLSAIFWARLDRIHFANTRADAAQIGFDDAAIYDEVARPLNARKIPIIHEPSDEAAAVFADWDRMDGKTRY